MFSVLNSKLLSIGVASIIAVGVIGAASIALADEPAPGATPPGQRAAREPRSNHVGAGLLAVGKILQDAGVTRDELKQGSADAKTVAEIIVAYGDKDVATVKTDVLAALDARLAAAVASDKLTQPQADKIKNGAPALFDRLMSAKPGDHQRSGDRKPRLVAIGKHALKTVADTLGLEPKALLEQLKGGKTIAQVAGDKTGAVTQALTDQANAAIDKAVADGKLPADKAADAKAKVAQHIDKFVNELHRQPGDAPRRHGPKPGRGNQPPKAN